MNTQKTKTAFLLLFFIAGLIQFAAAQAKTNVTGVWNMRVTLSQGSGNPVLTLKQETDSTFTGTYKGTFGEAPLTGTIKDNKINIKITTPDLTITYNGTVEGKTMKGKVSLGSYGEGDFTGQMKE